MYQSERLEKILLLLQERGYVTVKELTEELDYSTATVNRDLNLLEQKKLVKRSYGGVTLPQQKAPPLTARYKQMEQAKNQLCKAATDQIEEGDVIFVDGSSTTEALGKYLIEKKDVTVITSNISLFLFLSENSTNAILLGGKIKELPFLLGGTETEASALQYRADKFFFSALAFTEDGEISADEEYETLRRIMAHNARKTYFIADREKIADSVRKVLFTFDDMTAVISDHPFPEETKRRYPNTLFLG